MSTQDLWCLDCGAMYSDECKCKASARHERIYDVLDDACEKAGLREGVTVLLDPVTTEAHIAIRIACPTLGKSTKDQILVAQKALYALASYIQVLGGDTGRAWPHQDDG